MKRSRFLNTILFSFLVSIILYFSSCSNLTETPAVIFPLNQYASISGDIILPQNGAFPQAIAAACSRSAFPSTTPSGTVTYTVEATATGETAVAGDTYTSGTITRYVINNIKIGVEWTITITMKVDDVPVLSGSNTITPLADSQQSSVNIEILPQQTDSGTGKVDLTISYANTTVSNRVASLSITVSGSTESTKWTNAYNATTDEEGKEISKTKIKFSHLPSGAYTITMNFLNSDGILVYSDTQTINIFDNLTTKAWVNNGGSSPINGYNRYEILATHLDGFALTQIYVGATPYSTSPSDTNGTGSIYAPLATVSRAVKTVNAMPKKDASDNPIEYTIHVKNGVTENVSETITVRNNTTIECWGTSVGDKAGVATLTWTSDATTNTSMFSIYSSTKLVIEGVKSWAGPGETNPTWSGIVLNGNKANSKIGYGINVCSGELHLNGGVIKNFKTASDGSYSAAIYFSYNSIGNVYINGGIIENNESSYGAISIDSPQSNKHEMIMNDGIIRNNTATSQGGGGVHVSRGTFRMRGGEISGNTAPEGGGVYVYYNISDSCYGLFDMSGGKISGNSSTSYGGGVYGNGQAGIYIYGNSIIGDENASEPATEEEGHHSNIALNGGGIYGQCYIGYKPGGPVNADGYIPFSSLTQVKEENSAVKIYYNYSTAESSDSPNYGGGGVCSSTKVSGATFAYNGAAYEGGAISSGGEIRDCTFIENEAANFGGAIAIINTNTFIGTIDCEYGGSIGKNDIYMRNSGWGYTNLKMSVSGPITSSAGKKPHVVSGTYSDDKLFIKLADTLESTTTITAACSSFILESDGQKVWEVEPNETSGEGLLKSRFGTKKASEAKDKYDIVFKDGSATPYSTTMNLSTVQQNAAIAIIFYKGTELNNDGDNSTVRTLGVGLINGNTNGYTYCKNNVTGYTRSFTSTIYDEVMGTGYKNGSNNYEKVCTELGLTTLPDSNQEYSALTYGYAYKTKASGLGLSSNTISEYQTGWYAPSALELYYLCMECKNASESLNTKIAACRTNATVFEMTRQYFSSSQSKDESSKALAVDFASGEFVHKTKNYTGCACAIHEF